jgi:hypothetical protein
MDIKEVDEKINPTLVTDLPMPEAVAVEQEVDINQTAAKKDKDQEVQSKTWERIQNRKRKRSFNPMKSETNSPTLKKSKKDPTYNMNKLNVEIQMMYDEMTQNKIGKLAAEEKLICEIIQVADILIGQFNKCRKDVENSNTISLDQYGEEVARFKELFEKVSLNDSNTYNPFPEGVDLENVDEETLIGFTNNLTNFVEGEQYNLTKLSRDLKTAIEFHLQVSMITSARVGKESDIDRMIRGQEVRG